MSNKPLLVEIGTEELPPKSLQTLGSALLEQLCARLDESVIAHGQGRWYASPRRLAVLIDDVASQQDDTRTERLGPALKAARDGDGNPSPAALGFARSCGVEFANLVTVDTPKGERLAFHETRAGQATALLLGDILNESLAALPVAKRMRWGVRRDEFVRPLHWLVLLHGKQLLDAEVLGARSQASTRGHRLHCKEALTIDSAVNYEELLLNKGYVIADFNCRRERIREQVEQQARALDALAVIDSALLDEVTGLVEWPVAYTGHFDTRFLDVPAEALVSSMQSHQKYFPVTDQHGKLQPHFIFIANLESDDPEQVRSGNERVITPRLSDAAFFYQTDCRETLAARRDKLHNIVFQSKLGSLWDKTERVATLSAYCAAELGADVDHCRRAASLSKADLVSEMVLEFDDLQGTMGRYYATNDGEPEAVAVALEEQYLPRHAGDRVPTEPVGICLAICDRTDTLVGLFGIGQPPTGSKDPFALRRSSLAILRTVIANELDLDLRPLIETAASSYESLPKADAVVEEVLAYVFERLRAWYQDEGFAAEIYQAVAARHITRPLDFDRRVRAVAAFCQLPSAASLAAANKRVANILAKADDVDSKLDETRLKEPAEQALATLVAGKANELPPLLDAARYSDALQALAELRDSVDRFFDEVMVNCEDATLRRNRIALLAQLRRLFLEIADVSLLAGTL